MRIEKNLFEYIIIIANKYINLRFLNTVWNLKFKFKWYFLTEHGLKIKEKIYIDM